MSSFIDHPSRIPLGSDDERFQGALSRDPRELTEAGCMGCEFDLTCALNVI